MAKARENATQRALYAAVLAHRPIGVVDVAKIVGVSVQHASWHLRALRCRGLIGPTREKGRGIKWTTAAAAAKERAEWARIRESLSAQKIRRASKKNFDAGELDAWCDHQPVHRYVPSGMWASQGLRQAWHP